MYIFLTINANTADCFFIYRNSKSIGVIFISRKHSRNKIYSILYCIRIWYAISKIVLNFFIGYSHGQIFRI